jgi:uncharacterized protein YwgA
MNRSQRQIVLLSLIQQLRANDSWCGETHIQKSAYFLQELLGVPLDLNVIFYKHGPYSFDLSDEITALRADGLLSVQSREPYGPGLLPTESANKLLVHFSSRVDAYGPQVRFVAERLGPKKVAELERLATALYVRLQSPSALTVMLADEIHRLKPHVSPDEGLEALRTVRQMQDELHAIQAP